MGEFVSIDSGYVSIDSQSSRRFNASSSVVTNGPVCCLVTAAAGWPGVEPRSGAIIFRRATVILTTHLTGHRTQGLYRAPDANLAGLSIIWRPEACVESWSLVSRVSTAPGPSITVVLVTLQRPLLLLPGSSHYSPKCLPQVSTSSHIKHSTIQTSLCIYSTVFVCLPVLPLCWC